MMATEGAEPRHAGCRPAPRRWNRVDSVTGPAERIVSFSAPGGAVGERPRLRAAEPARSPGETPAEMRPETRPEMSREMPAPPAAGRPSRTPRHLVPQSPPKPPEPARRPPVSAGSALPAILPATRLAIVPLCAADGDQALALAIAVAGRLAALTARPGAIVTADAAAMRHVRSTGRRRGVRLDGFSVLARCGNVSMIASEDAGAAAIAVSARLPLVSLVAADEQMAAALDEIRPGALLLLAGERTGARYLELAKHDLAARLPAARVLCAGFGDRADSNSRSMTGRDEDLPAAGTGERGGAFEERACLMLVADRSAALRLRLGVRAAPATRISADTLAECVLGAGP